MSMSSVAEFFYNRLVLAILDKGKIMSVMETANTRKQIFYTTLTK